MTSVYILIFILFILGGIGYGAYYIYNDTMQRMAVLRENNAKLEVALDSKDAVIEELQNNMQKQIELSNELNAKLTQAEKENTAIIMVSHNLEIASKMHKTYKLDEGSLVEVL